MPNYKVLKDFHWGKMYLQKGKTITIDEKENGVSLVSIADSNDIQIVGTKAVQGMILLEKIKKL